MDEERLARMEVLLEGGTQDLQRTRELMEHGLKELAGRVGMLEVHVRALQDKELADKVLVKERERVAEETAERMLEHRHRQVSRRDLWLTALLLVGATILAALIASGHLF